MTKDEIIFLRESNNIEDEWDDMALQDAIEAWEWVKEKDVLTEKNIKYMHKLLMRSRSTIDAAWKGIYRIQDVWIGGNLVTWQSIAKKMSHWIMNANDIVVNGQEENKDFLHKRIQDHHVAYEKIHCWLDGNGRSGRILMNWQRIKLGLPILVIKEKEKQKYYSWFK
jgi:fido (protein-threonine AMPylation protein)